MIHIQLFDYTHGKGRTKGLTMIIKKIIGTLILGTISMNSYVSQACAPEKPEDTSPSRIEFAWDLHETLVTFDKVGIAKTFLATMHTQAGLAALKLIVGLVVEYPLYLMTGKSGKNKTLLDNLKQLTVKSTVAEEYFEVIEQHDPRLRAPAEQLAACYKEMPGMLELLRELHELGYTQRLASNIGDKSELKNIQKKVPHIFTYLNGGKAVAYENRPTIIRKPSLDYYFEYQNQFNPERTKTVIFIDDDPFNHHCPLGPSNTQAARDAGMIGISFKNCQQLRQELKALGIQLK